MSLVRNALFLACVIGLGLLAFFAGEAARAATPTWKDVSGLELSSPTAHCPEGELLFEAAKDGEPNMLNIGAMTELEWKGEKPESEIDDGGDGEGCKTTTTSSGTSSEIKVKMVIEKCKDKKLNGERSETLRIVDAKTLQYDFESRYGKNKPVKRSCVLKASSESK